MRKYAKATVNLLVTLVALLFVVFVLPRVLLFFTPFLVGWLIALMAAPIVQFFEKRLKIRRKAGGVVVIVTTIALVILLLYLIVGKLVEEAAGFLQSLPTLWKSMEADVYALGRQLDGFYDRMPTELQNFLTSLAANAEKSIGTLAESIQAPMVNAVGNLAKNVPTVLIGMIMSVLSAYLFVAERETIGSFMRVHTPQYVQEKCGLIWKSLTSAVGGYFKAQFRIELWIYLLLVLGLMFLRVEYSLLIALGVAILDFLPLFGTGAVMWPWAAVKAAGGDYRMALGLMIIWGVCQLVRQIIQPKIVGDSVGLSPLPTLFLLYIGYQWKGVIGMLIAIPLGMIVFNLYQAGVFDTAKESVKLLLYGLNSFRKFTEEEKSLVDKSDCQQSKEEK